MTQTQKSTTLIPKFKTESKYDSEDETIAMSTYKNKYKQIKMVVNKLTYSPWDHDQNIAQILTKTSIILDPIALDYINQIINKYIDHAITNQKKNVNQIQYDKTFLKSNSVKIKKHIKLLFDANPNLKIDTQNSETALQLLIQLMFNMSLQHFNTQLKLNGIHTIIEKKCKQNIAHHSIYKFCYLFFLNEKIKKKKKNEQTDMIKSYLFEHQSFYSQCLQNNIILINKYQSISEITLTQFQEIIAQEVKNNYQTLQKKYNKNIKSFHKNVTLQINQKAKEIKNIFDDDAKKEIDKKIDKQINLRIQNYLQEIKMLRKNNIDLEKKIIEKDAQINILNRELGQNNRSHVNTFKMHLSLKKRTKVCNICLFCFFCNICSICSFEVY